jgi:hypothetical protein
MHSREPDSPGDISGYQSGKPPGQGRLGVIPGMPVREELHAAILPGGLPGGPGSGAPVGPGERAGVVADVGVAGDAAVGAGQVADR